MKRGKSGAGTQSQELRHNELTLQCLWSDDGKLRHKTERFGRDVTEFAYFFDAPGHLVRVEQHGQVTEAYRYNTKGQRIAQRREGRSGMPQEPERLRYDAQGRLETAGGMTFDYDACGVLSGCYTQRGGDGFFLRAEHHAGHGSPAQWRKSPL